MIQIIPILIPIVIGKGQVIIIY